MARKHNKSKTRSYKKKNTKSNRKYKRNFFTRKLRGGFDYGNPSWNESMRNPYLNYSVNDYINDPLNLQLSARNINGGRNQSKININLRKTKLCGGNTFGTGTPITNAVGFSFGSSANAGSANIFTNSGIPITSEIYDNKNSIIGII